MGGQPRGVAVDAGHVYWADLDRSSIGRANIDGTGANPSFITGTGATGVAVDAGHIYWTYGGNAIGRANLDGSNVQQQFIGSGASNITTDANFIYWTTGGGGTNPAIDRANIDGSNFVYGLIQGRALANPNGIAVDSGHIYWTNTIVEGGGYASLGRANLDGSAPNAHFINAPAFNLALLGGRIYWTENASKAVAVANVDGTAVNRHLFSAGNPAGLAVDSRPGNPPGSTPTSGGGGPDQVLPGVSLLPTAAVSGSRVRIGKASNPPATSVKVVLKATLPRARHAGLEGAAVVGRASVSIPEGKTLPLIAQLSPAARAVVRRRGQLSVRASVFARLRDGRMVTTTRLITFRRRGCRARCRQGGRFGRVLAPSP